MILRAKVIIFIYIGNSIPDTVDSRFIVCLYHIPKTEYQIKFLNNGNSIIFGQLNFTKLGLMINYDNPKKHIKRTFVKSN